MLKIRISMDNAQKFIADRLKNATDELCFVTIEPKLRQLELLPCLLAAREAAKNPGDYFPKFAAIKAFRNAAQARGFDIGLADAKNIIEQFIL